MSPGRVVTREEWQEARDELLRREKEHTRMGDELARLRRELPWFPVEKGYEFETDEGRRPLAGLFEGRSQLLVYHFMFGPSYQAGCPVCSSIADALDGVLPHLHARDTTVVLVSRAALPRLQAYRERMGWRLPWASSESSDFNFDYGVSHSEDELRDAPFLTGDPPPVLEQMADATGTDVAGYVSEGPGLSGFALEDGTVYQTYSTYARGLEFVMTYYPLLDRTPKGRDEGGPGSRHWIRRHDEY